MGRPTRVAAAAGAALLALGSSLQAQRGPDPVLEALVREGTERSQVDALAHALLDSVGPRLTGSPGERAAHALVAARYRDWGVQARAEPYGTWPSWRRGPFAAELLAPRPHTLRGALLAWSPGTEAPVEAEAVVLPALDSPAEFERWLTTHARGRWVLVSAPQASCRPPEDAARWGGPDAARRDSADRADAARAWALRVAATGSSERWLPMRLEEAGAAGVVASEWVGGGIQVHNAWTARAPMLTLSCADYGLLFRLAEGGGAPVMRVDAPAVWEGEVPVSNTLAVLPGRELPEEYVVLSAHLDSWDGADGATDNGAGTVAVMEAMRILRSVHPTPRRTIVAAHWSGEEQGLNGSLAFAEAHPQVVEGMQALFNLDQGTGRVRAVSMQGLSAAGAAWRRWLARLPDGMGAGIEVRDPGEADASGSDHVSFVCRGAPAFHLEQVPWDYRTRTWHTDADTRDQLVPGELRANALLLAALAYLASEDPVRLSRDRAGGAAPPPCRAPARSIVEFLERLLQ